MIRAVTRYTLEINRPASPYFERAICFVKPEYAQNDRLDLHRAAHQLISSLDAGVEEQTSPDDDAACEAAADASSDTRSGRIRRITARWLPLVLSAVIGAGAAVLVMLLI